MMRNCGGCTLCCKLLPMQAGSQFKYPETMAVVAMGLATSGAIGEFDKPAGKRCPHQRHDKGCMVYQRRPISCQMWNCRWLTGDDTGDLHRPDRAGYVIDIMPDWSTLTNNYTGEQTKVQVVQIWVDPSRRDDWRHDKALLAYIDRRGREGIATLIRFNTSDALAVFPPAMSSDGEWHEVGGRPEGDHRPDEILDGLAECVPVKLDVPT